MSVDHIYILIEKRAIPFQARRALDYGGCPGGWGLYFVSYRLYSLAPPSPLSRANRIG